MLGGGGLSMSDQTRQDARSAAEANFGNVFSAPFAVGRAASATAEATNSATKDTGGGTASTQTLLIIGGVVLLGIVLWKTL